MRLLAAAWLLAAPARAALPGTDKPFGVLLMGEGDDEVWRKTLTEAKAKLGKKFPLEFAAGEGDDKELQKAAAGLERQKVRMIVAVPLYVSSFSEAMDQTRYLFGIRENPSKEFLKASGARGAMLRPGRVKTKVPIVMTKALDDHSILVEILASRAHALTKDLDASKATLLLAGEGPESEAANKDWQDQGQALAEKVRVLAGFKAAKILALREPARQTEREKNQSGLRKRVQDARKEGPVVIVPLELTKTNALTRLPRVLDGIPVKYDGKTILYDDRILKFVEQSAEAGARLPDMRMFKDEKKGVPKIDAPPSLSQQRIDTKPSIDTKPHLGDSQ